MTAHSQVAVGKRVRVVLKDGTAFVDRFLATFSKVIAFEERGVIRKSRLKSMTIYRPRPKALT